MISHRQSPVQIGAVHREPDLPILATEVAHVWQLAQLKTVAMGARRDGGAHEVPQLGEGAGLALGVGACLLVRVEFEALDQLVAAPGVYPVASQPCQEVDGLHAGQVGPQRHIAWHVGDPAVQRHRVAPGIATEQPHGPAVGAQQSQQHADGGGLARAVRAEEAGDITGRDGQVEAVERLGAAERLGQTPDFDGGL